MSRAEDYRDGTRCVRAGLPAARRGEPFLPGPTFAAPYHLAGSPGAAPEPSSTGSERAGQTELGYGREDNPTWQRYEAALGELEGGHAVSFASGMAAVCAVLLTAAGPEDTIVLPADGYYATRKLAQDWLRGLGLTIRELPTAVPLADEQATGTALVLLETPSNPGLDVCDIAAAAKVAHRHGALLAVDNTTATPLGQRPLDLGADYSCASDTKALTGHSDLLLGHVAVADPARAGRLRAWRTLSGGVPGPFEVWLAHRSLGTLDLRLARQADNALALARMLADRPEVTGLRYPGLPTDPGHALAVRQMRRLGGVISFVLPSEQAVHQFLAGARLIAAATSFGGLHTTADRRAQWGGDAVPAGFVRLSVGCEDAADLIADVSAALDGLGDG